MRDAAFGGTAAPLLFHIHAGAAGVNGPVVVDFTALLPSGIGCGVITSTDKHLVQKIRQHPEQYYVNMHTAGVHGRRHPGPARHRAALSPASRRKGKPRRILAAAAGVETSAAARSGALR